jgi:hypothetical protein
VAGTVQEIGVGSSMRGIGQRRLRMRGQSTSRARDELRGGRAWRSRVVDAVCDTRECYPASSRPHEG